MNVKITVLGQGQTFGEQDIFTERKFQSSSLTCTSSEGEIYCLKIEEFHKRFKSDTDTYKTLLLSALNKEVTIIEKTNEAKMLQSRPSKVDCCE